MTVGGLALVCAIIVAGAIVGFATRRFVEGKRARLVAIFFALLPLLAYYVWGAAIGCLGDPELESEASSCFGWGFGALLLYIAVLPAWLIGLGLGYICAWARAGRSGA